MAVFPTIQMLVAFQNNPNDDPALITTVASPAGTLGGSNVWTDIGPWVSQFQIQRGRQHELQAFQAGTLTVDLINLDGRFNSWNTSGPYTGFLDIRKPVQVRATWNGTTYKRFTGHVDAWPTVWDLPGGQHAQMHASDAFRTMGIADLTTGGYGAQVIADGAAGYWRLNEPPGSVGLADSSGNGHAGVVVQYVTLGSTSALPADPDTSAQLSVAATGVQEITWPQVWGTISGGTIEYWYNSSDSSGSLNPQIVNTCTMAAFASPVSVSLDVSVAGGGIILDVGGTPVTPTALCTTQDGNWHHLAVTFTSGAASSNQLATLNYYLDGVNIGSHTNVGVTVATNKANGVVTFNTPTTVFNLQEVAFYPSALSGAQILAHFNLATWPQQSTDARIAKVLNTVNWSSGARNLDTGISTVQKQTASLVTTPALTHMQDVETTEGGALYMTVDGKVRFISRADLVSGSTYGTSQATFGDNVGGGDLPFQLNPSLALDDIDLYTEASGQRQGGNRQVVDNATAITSYGRSTWNPPGNLLGISDQEVLNQMQYVVNNRSTPHSRISKIDIDFVALTVAQVATMLGLELLYRVTVERTILTGASYTEVALIEMLTETVTPSSWTVTLGLDPADTTGYWVLGTATLGQTTSLYY